MMECLVLHGATVVGHVTLAPPQADAPPDAAGPTWTGLLRPTPAYEPIRATCQAFTRLLTAAPRSPSSERGDVATGFPDGMAQMLEAIIAVRALDLQLATLAGAPLATTQVLIQDASEMHQVLPTDEAREASPDELVMVLATLGEDRA